MRMLIVILFLISTAALAADAQKKKAQVPSATPSWRFERVVDKMSDEVSCHLNSPRAKLIFSFQTHAYSTYSVETVYLFSNDLLALRTHATLTIRVDKNEPFKMYNREIFPNSAAVNGNDYIEEWLAQMKVGKTLLARLISTSGGLDEEYSLASFAPAFAAYNECLTTLQ
jgi:hypothetical protein